MCSPTDVTDALLPLPDGNEQHQGFILLYIIWERQSYTRRRNETPSHFHRRRKALGGSLHFVLQKLIKLWPHAGSRFIHCCDLTTSLFSTRFHRPIAARIGHARRRGPAHVFTLQGTAFTSPRSSSLAETMGGGRRLYGTSNIGTKPS
ncbi:unnamed protein product [Pieris brassicae]|uniref:Uncharacterized protein n=1 Tax=Pieris brassicae TaxID=7116 RepID=A0A9P0TKX9_PIEBR|nr:unnamed protein product [Pieris brassicae]